MKRECRVAARALQTLSTVVFGVALAGCGYHFTGDVMGLPSDVRSIAVGTIQNHSGEDGLEKSLAFALEREILLHRQLRVEEDTGAGDALLTGTIRDVRFRPVAFNANDIAVLYEIILVVDLTLTRQHDGHVLWRTRGFQETDEYSTSGATIVTSSSQFQQGTLNASNLDNPQFATRTSDTPVSIQLAETDRRQALGRLLQQTSRDVYNQIVEDF